jgi:short-subunit dehydrogenase
MTLTKTLNKTKYMNTSATKDREINKMTKNKTVLITGCGSGIGKDTAVALARRRHKVIATTRTAASAEEINSLAANQKLSIESFKLDVTVPEDREKILGYDINVLINNAGIGESGSLAEIDVERIRNNFEVNVFGPLELTQLALKNMMKKDAGTVIFVGSLVGRIALPFLAPYCMTKFSLSGGADSLRQELRKVTKNVHVSIVELGGYHTGFNQKNIAGKYEWMGKDSYFNEIIDEIRAQEARYFRKAELHSTKTAIDVIVRAVEAKNPKLRYVAPWWQGAFVQLERIFGK